MRTLIPPPPPKNKNRLWDRYVKGEVLKPTYEPIELRSKVPPPPLPPEPRSMKQGQIRIDPNLVIHSKPIGIREGFGLSQSGVIVIMVIVAIVATLIIKQ